MPKPPANRSSPGSIDAFLARVGQLPARNAASTARLAFVIDATASRQPTWDHACDIQARMFEAVGKLGALQVQLVYFRGYGELCASSWATDARQLAQQMTGVQCRAGHTQIGRALRHLLRVTTDTPLSAAIYIGDACEESGQEIIDLAGQLGIRRVPLFLFQEGDDLRTGEVFERAARASGGAFCRFDRTSAGMLEELLSAVATYATGGIDALRSLPQSRGTRLLLQKLDS